MHRKIFVTGNAGSGKSTFSKEIARHTGITRYDMDRIAWRAGWQKVPPAERQAALDEMLAHDSWIFDGVDDRMLQAADQVVFLDFPRRVCFYRALNRSCRHLFSSRPDMPPNCPEILILPTLIRIIWRFPKRKRPGILACKAKRGDRFVHIRNKQDLQAYLKSLPA